MNLLNANWLEYTLEDVTSLIKDGSHGTHEDVSDGVPLLSAKDVLDGKLQMPEDCRRISESDYRIIHKNYEIARDDILLTIVGSIGRCCLINGAEPRFSIQRSVAVIRPFDVVSEYLYHFLRSEEFQSRLRDYTNASAQGGVYLGALAKCRVKVPTSRSEQTKIAEILSTVDRAIEQTEALIAKQQRIKTGLMQDLLTRGIDEHGNLRSEQTHKFKDSPLGRIPAEWEVVPVSSVLAQPPKNGYSPVEADNWDGIYMLGLGCLTNYGYEPKQLKYAPGNNRLTEKAKLHSGDFLISRSNTRALVGLVGIYRDIGDTCIYPDLMMRLRFANVVTTDYMEQVFMSSAMRRQIENAATGTSGSMVKINAAIVKEFIFSRPPLQEQSRIILMLQTEADNLLKESVSLSKLRSLKTALMQDLLTGNKRVTSMLNDIILSN